MGRVPRKEGASEVNRLKHIRSHHRDIMLRLAAGQRQVDIAAAIGMSQTQLSIIVTSPLFKAEFAQIEKDVRARAVENIGDLDGRLQTLRPKALDTIESIMKDKKNAPARLRRDCARDILDMSSGKKKRDEEGMSDFGRFVSTAFAQSAIDEIKAAAVREANTSTESTDVEEEVIDIDGDVAAFSSNEEEDEVSRKEERAAREEKKTPKLLPAMAESLVAGST